MKEEKEKRTKILKQNETYRGTPYIVMQAIERTIGRKFTIEEIGWLYHTLHLSIDGIDERGHMLNYDNQLFRVVFNSENTVIIAKV